MKPTNFAGMSVKTVISLVLVAVSFIMLFFPWMQISIETFGQTYTLEKLVDMACTYEGMSKAQLELEMQSSVGELASDMSQMGIMLNVEDTLDMMEMLISGKMSLIDMAKLLTYTNGLLGDIDKAIGTFASSMSYSSIAQLSMITDAKTGVMIAMIVVWLMIAAAVALFVFAVISIRGQRNSGVIAYGVITAVLFVFVMVVVGKANDIVQTYASAVMEGLEELLDVVGMNSNAIQSYKLFHLTAAPILSILCVAAALVLNLARVKVAMPGNINLSGLGQWGCPTCRAQNKFTDAYCIYCGTKRPEKPRCECGAVIREGVAFCGVCGRQLRNPAAEQIIPPAPPAVPAPAAAARACLRCGNPVYGEAIYCEPCTSAVYGSQNVGQPRTCARCGNPVYSNSVYCESCNAALTGYQGG